MRNQYSSSIYDSRLIRQRIESVFLCVTIAKIDLLKMVTGRALHFVFKIPDRKITCRFYREILGMKVSSLIIRIDVWIYGSCFFTGVTARGICRRL